MKYLVIFLTIFLSACSAIDDYSKGIYEDNYSLESNEAIEENLASLENVSSANENETYRSNDIEDAVEDLGSSEDEIEKPKVDSKDDINEGSIKTKDDKEKKTDNSNLIKQLEEVKEKVDKVVKEENKKNESNTKDKKESEQVETIDLLNTKKNEDPIVKSDINIDGLSNKALSWWYRPGKPVSTIDKEISEMLSKYSGLWQAPTGSKKMYLTFDEGYEYNENTSKILDTLKEKNVKAAFFITGHFIKSRTDLVKRMVNEGHAVCNHTVNHMNPPKAISNNKFVEEIEGLEKLYDDLVGGNMSPFYRPPEGGYSEATLSAAESLGYKTTFWSFAYKDWEVDNQPDSQAALDKISSHFHDGSIILLHAVSNTNASILGQVIDRAYEMGYTFGDLRELK